MNELMITGDIITFRVARAPLGWPPARDLESVSGARGEANAEVQENFRGGWGGARLYKEAESYQRAHEELYV